MFDLDPQATEYHIHMFVVEVDLTVKVAKFLNHQLFLVGKGLPLLRLFPDNAVHFGPVGRETAEERR